MTRDERRWMQRNRLTIVWGSLLLGSWRHAARVAWVFAKVALTGKEVSA
jgi:hypothetical protein